MYRLLFGCIFSEELDDMEALGLLMFLIVLTAFSILLANILRRFVMGVSVKSLPLVDVNRLVVSNALGLVEA